MLIPAFSFKLNHKIINSLVTTGNVIIHNPYIDNIEGSDGINNKKENEFKQLSINRKITALNTGNFDDKDVLLVGTQSNIMAYDIDRNSDLFYRDVPDGVHSMIFGKVATVPNPVVIVGGNCSLQGFDKSGNEVFWTVTGDNVSALAWCDVDEDGNKELLVGSEDYGIRIFSGEKVISDVTEADVVSFLAPIRGPNYGYALQNGGIGVYNKYNKLWGMKAKNKVTSLNSYDLDGDGVPELLSGWSNGKFEIRSDSNGDLIYSDKFSSPVAAMCLADYRMDGKEEIIIICEDGEVKGYLPAEKELAMNNEIVLDDKVLQELLARKAELVAELSSFETNFKQVQSGQVNASVLASNTECKISFEPNRKIKGLDIRCKVNNNAIVKTVVIFANALFEGESLIVYPKDNAADPSDVVIPLPVEKDMIIDLNIKVMVGHRSSIQDHVFESVHRLPKFSAFELVKNANIKECNSSVSFALNERCNRIALWINQSFTSSIELNNAADSVLVSFISLRDPKVTLQLKFTSENQTFTIKTDDMELAGSIVQDLCLYMGISDLSSIADFPQEFIAFKEVLDLVEEYNSVRTKMSADTADSSNLIKSLIIKAEDARILENMSSMRKSYNDLFDQNQDLLGEYAKREKNQQLLLDALKQVNVMIQRAAKLRIGKYKAEVITGCRDAIKTNNVQALFRIMKSGRTSN